ncbi:hypothetical protein EV178_001004 [Coemansia sp. RSA 1646]|nr:hypothetical protein EV178_001004 [Coemansia sp. RSA 1646]KAJ1772254.1 hypothetical protein LPJ74_001684 [Coemansia sp. RSA 1843]KAJ2091886.1 hypothetical protein IW138_001575 [Coemansia sp. RSA 986]KAJ2215788.1 hypothetical protein EV179_001808 [Coemansia sp. RSA 487]
MDGPAIKAALGAAYTSPTDSTNIEGISGKAFFSSISKFVGNLAMAPKSALQDLILFLISNNKLTRLYTDDVHTAFFQFTAGVTTENYAEFESRLVCIHGRATDLVCKKCTSKSKFSQAMLFKVMGGQTVSCSVCGACGSVASSLDSTDDRFVPEILDTKTNDALAAAMAEADAAAHVDLLLVFGDVHNSSKEFTDIASAISRTSKQTIVVSESEPVFFDSLGLPNPPLLCRINTETAAQNWVKQLTYCADDKHTTADSTNTIDHYMDSVDSGLITGVTDITLVESSSPAESSDDRAHAPNGLVFEDADIGRSKESSHGRGKKQKGKSREKTNFNHLLNFSLPPRLPPPTLMMRPRRRAANMYSSERQAQINRTMFINANFRFALKPQFWQNFKPITVRPDMQLRWEWIERVIMPVTGEPINCPICLSPPIAARVTECGHVFCFPCILRFLSYDSDEEKHNKKCPVCWSAITNNDLFPVHFWKTQYFTGMSENAIDSRPDSMYATQKLGAGSCITMRLMKRLRGTTICMPRSTSSHIYSQDAIDCAKSIAAASKQGSTKSELAFKSHHCPWTFTRDALPFAKFVLADQEYCIGEYKQEIAELDSLKGDDTTDLDSRLFAESATMSVDHMLKAYEAFSAQDTTMERSARKEQRILHDDKGGNNTLASQPSAVDETSADSFTQRNDHKQESNNDEFVYFYQANDGQHIYMHPLPARVVSHEYGSHSDMPDELEVKVRHSVESTITDDVRQQFKMLNHLPLRCDVLFIEPELKGLVSRKSIEKFRPQLSHRDKQHAARAKQAALDEARSEFLAAAAQAMEPPEHSFVDSGGHGRSTPDESSFPALNDSAVSEADFVADKSNQQQPKKSLWPRAPLPSSTPYSNEILNSDFWEEFERAAESSRHKGNRNDEEDHHHYDGPNDPEDFVISPKSADGHSASKKNRRRKVKLVLSGSGAHRRR